MPEGTLGGQRPGSDEPVTSPAGIPAEPDGSVVFVERCPECASGQVLHLWRADMERLELIDDWKCLSATCGHRWDATLTYAQLERRSARRDSAGEP